MGGSWSDSASGQITKVELLDGTELPCETLGEPTAPSLVWGHGLGPRDPRAMNRRTCESYDMIRDALSPCMPSSDSGLTRITPFTFSAVLYDARGHGSSSGWEPSAAKYIQQFHWRSLAFDMLAVAMKHQRNTGRHGALLGGYSMGASSALWAAYQCPHAVRGLVLCCVTTAWEIRSARRGSLLSLSQALEASDPPAASCIRGAAFSDLPSIEELCAAQLQMPVLIMCARDDATHPAEVAERLAKALPNSKLVVTDTTTELRTVFPGELQNWLAQLFSSSPENE